MSAPASHPGAVSEATGSKQQPSFVKVICEAIMRINPSKPDFSLFLSLTFGLFGGNIIWFETLPTESVLEYVFDMWSNKCLELHTFLKQVLYQSKWPASEHARMVTKLRPLLKDPLTGQQLDKVDRKLQRANQKKMIACMLRQLEPHEEYIRNQEWNNLTASGWGDTQDTEDPKKSGDLGFVDWCNPLNWEQDRKPELSAKQQSPMCIEDVWDLICKTGEKTEAAAKADLGGETETKVADLISLMYLLGKVLQNLSPKGWACITTIIQGLVRDVHQRSDAFKVEPADVKQARLDAFLPVWERIRAEAAAEHEAECVAARAAGLPEPKPDFDSTNDSIENAEWKHYMQMRFDSFVKEATLGMGAEEVQLVLSSLQDCFLMLSMLLERMFLNFWYNTPEITLVRPIIDAKLREWDPDMDCDKFIPILQHNIAIVRVFGRHVRVQDLDTTLLSGAIFRDLSMHKKVELKEDDVVANAREIRAQADAAAAAAAAAVAAAAPSSTSSSSSSSTSAVAAK